jgi:hypothetical protein
VAGIRLSAAPNELRGLIFAINKMDKEASGALRDDVASISRWTAQGIIASSYQAVYPKQAAIVASTVRPMRDRLPYVQIGGRRGQYSGGAVAGQTLFGSEFGARGRFPNGGRRFPLKDYQGLWIFKALREMQPEITRRWKNSVDKVLDNWSKY